MKIIIIIPDGMGGAPKKPAYTPAGHSEACQKRHAAAEAWATLWPNHCAKCRGAGVLEYSEDPSPAGVSLSAGSMDYAEPCSCVCDERCPRCGESLLGRRWQHPRCHLASAIRTHQGRVGSMIRLTSASWLYRVLELARVPDDARVLAARRLTSWLAQRHEVADALSDLADWLAPLDIESPCGFCGWSGEREADAMPADECLCWEDHQTEVELATATGSMCWRCERPFDGETPGLQAKIPIFGVRWLHPGCVSEGDRLVEPAE